MTDRIHALTVVLDGDLREDDARPLIDAIRQLRHVAAVSAHVLQEADDVARQRVRSDLAARLTALIREVLYDNA